VSRRDLIRMTPRERDEFLDEQRTVICATTGPDGWPHLMPLWFVVRDGDLWSWTYAKSQKVRNLERDSRATVQVEDGEEYQELRGLMWRARVRVLRDVEDVRALGIEIYERYTGAGPGNLPAEVEEMVAKQAPKRVALHFVGEGEPVTWDHRKLGGVY
jgi:PPOX class probable F420-dependent enzyme